MDTFCYMYIYCIQPLAVVGSFTIFGFRGRGEVRLEATEYGNTTLTRNVEIEEDAYWYVE
jgi:hypothetical protein